MYDAYDVYDVVDVVDVASLGSPGGMEHHDEKFNGWVRGGNQHVRLSFSSLRLKNRWLMYQR